MSLKYLVLFIIFSGCLDIELVAGIKRKKTKTRSEAKKEIFMHPAVIGVLVVAICFAVIKVYSKEKTTANHDDPTLDAIKKAAAQDGIDVYFKSDGIKVGDNGLGQLNSIDHTKSYNTINAIEKAQADKQKEST